MDCPRCRLLMSESDYEGQHVHFCGTCWGYWLTRGQLDQIVAATKYRFDRDEARAVRQTISTHGDANRQGAEHQAVPCPICRGEMSKTSYAASCPIEIDECQAHGVWLDTGEIKDLQIIVERSLR